jgi:hypothetical protein
MDFLIDALKQPFVWGLLLGLLAAFFTWKSAFSNRRRDAREIRRLEQEIRELQSHLNTQLKISATGNETLISELEALRSQNENLRIANSALQAKPGRAELRLLQVYEIAIGSMREQAPGFAAAWEKALRHGEAELEAANSGLKKLVRRVIPGYGTPPLSHAPAIEIAGDKENQ